MGPNPRLRLALCQVNPTVGDIAGNEALIRAESPRRARRSGNSSRSASSPSRGTRPRTCCTRSISCATREARSTASRRAPEGSLPSSDFPSAQSTSTTPRLFSRPVRSPGSTARFICRTTACSTRRRYFAPASRPAIIDLGVQLIGITICEDIWVPAPVLGSRAAGASLIVNISASPYHAGKGREREERSSASASRRHGVATAFCAIVGGQDELVFDGQSFVLDRGGTLVARAAQFSEELLMCDSRVTAAHRRIRVGRAFSPRIAISRPPPAPATFRRGSLALLEPREAEIYAALECGLRDYVRKNGFQHVVLGLSGGIDSALVATIAATRSARARHRGRHAISHSPRRRRRRTRERSR